MVGIACGTYTSICITGALWYVMKTKVGAGAKELAAAEQAAVTMNTEGVEDKAAASNAVQSANSAAKPKKKNKKRKQ